MSPKTRSFSVPVSRRADGEPWQLRFAVIEGSSPGPATAFVAGVFGDKPLGTMALWALARRLASEPGLSGSVMLCPAANPFALEAGTRVSPDHLYLNRVFPGAPRGFLTQQIAHALLGRLRDFTDCVVDLHSGTPDMALWYSYDYGDEELSASFGYTPIVTRMAQPGQLSKAFVDAGGRSVLVEFGGGALGDVDVGVEGCLNVLKYRGQLAGRATGPRTVPVVDGDVSIYMPSHTGVLTSAYPTSAVGSRVTPGPVAWLDCPATGERLEEFGAERDGALLMLARVSPAMASPGQFGAAIGYPSREIAVPAA
jgi:hypothetical protein